MYATTARPGVAECRVDDDCLLSFLEAQYVPEAGLLMAAIVAYPDNVTIWIASDDLLAAEALAVLGSPYSRIVSSQLKDKYGGGINVQYEVLLGIDPPS
ncbi:MAG: hypothetical protein F7C07_04095 [Desulfurococcales archaeon]|nr:hypothetical protein [Desulfurococcales archaeon]